MPLSFEDLPQLIDEACQDAGEAGSRVDVSEVMLRLGTEEDCAE